MSSSITESDQMSVGTNTSEKATEMKKEALVSYQPKKSNDRKTLQTLQEKAKKSTSVSEKSPGGLVGRATGGFAKLFASAKKKNGKGFQIYEDSPKSKSANSSPNSFKTLQVANTQTNITGADLDFQSMSSPDAQFYKELAEKRREALDESLNENEKLWIENEEQKEKIYSLEDTISSLEGTVEKARKIAEIIEPHLSKEDEDETSINATPEKLESKLDSLSQKVERSPIPSAIEEGKEKSENDNTDQVEEENESKAAASHGIKDEIKSEED